MIPVYGLSAASGKPVLNGTGSLHAGEPTLLEIKRGKPLAAAWLVIGADLLHVPFKQGTLVPAPDLVVGGLPLGATGTLALAFDWPAGLPAGLSLSFQCFGEDPATKSRRTRRRSRRGWLIARPGATVAASTVRGRGLGGCGPGRADG